MREALNKEMKAIALIILSGFLIYSALMIVSRLKMVELAYEFEKLKNDERLLHEEQMKVRAMISQRLSPSKLKAEGFEEPKPQQIVAIP